MPMESIGFVPRGIVEDEQPAYAVQRRDGLGEMIKVALEDIGIDAIHDERRAVRL